MPARSTICSSQDTESKPPELREGVKRKAVAKGEIDKGSAGLGRGCNDDDDACFGAAFSVDNMVLTLSPVSFRRMGMIVESRFIVLLLVIVFKVFVLLKRGCSFADLRN